MSVATYSVSAVQAALTPLDPGVSDYPAPVRAYFHYYGLDSFNARHAFGSVTVNGTVLAVHVFRPAVSHGTVLLVHGYYDHSGIWRQVIAALLAAGYSVVAYDQPGHGLSGGARATIGDFADYRTALAALLDRCPALVGAPVQIVAHSLGAAVVIDYLLHHPDAPIKHSVLLAPLLHSAFWRVSCLSQHLLGRWLTELPRVLRRNSADPDFVAFIRHDPLQARVAPTQWFRALVRWNRTLAALPPCHRALTVIQGEADTVVDWRYNLTRLQRLFPAATVTLVPGAGHQLHNEIQPLRESVLHRLLASLHHD